jgi:hypothetical protein
MKDTLIPSLEIASDSDFPFEWEEVDSLSARRALLTGRPRIVARYLREADAIDPRVIAIIDEMMGLRSKNRYELALVPRIRRGRGRPKADARQPHPVKNAGFTPSQLADVLDPRPGQDLILEFKRERRRPVDPNRYWRDRAIGFEVWVAYRKTGSVKAAKTEVWKARQRTTRAVSYATVKRAWDAFRRRRSKTR